MDISSQHCLPCCFFFPDPCLFLIKTLQCCSEGRTYSVTLCIKKSKRTDTNASEMILRVTRDLHLFCLRSQKKPCNRVLKPWTPPSPLALPVNNINLLTCLLFSLILVFSTGVISMCPCSKFMAKCRVKLYILMPEGSVLKTLKNKACL